MSFQYFYFVRTWWRSFQKGVVRVDLTLVGPIASPHAGIIYSCLFKYTQHTTRFTGEQLDPMLELSTPGCSSTHNTLHVLRENNWTPCWSYLLLAVQVHTTPYKFYGRTIGPHAGVIYSWLFKHTQHTGSFMGEQLVPHLLRSVLCVVHLT